MNRLISIIVPIYNAENTLDRCVKALIGQTYKNIEIILVNDGAKDCSLEICRRYETQDARIRVIDKTNGGVSSARNAGLDIAQGEFIMFCDSDDWAEPDWCEELMSHYEDGCLVMCGHYVEGQQSYVDHKCCAKTEERYEISDFYLLKNKFFSCTWNKVYNLDIIRRYNLSFDERIHNGEDYIFNLQYINCLDGRIKRLTKCVFHYTWPTGNSLSSKIPENYYNQVNIMFNGLKSELEKLNIKNKSAFICEYTGVFFQYQNGILKELVKKGSVIKKIKKTSMIMAAPEYQQCVKMSYVSKNKLYAALWRRKNSVGVWLWHAVVKLIGI